MIAYLVESTLMLTALWLLYKLLLENEKMHRFNRAFLLLALVAGLTVPIISVETVRNKLFTEKPTVIVTGIASKSSDLVQKAAEFPSKRVKITNSSVDGIYTSNSRDIAYERNFSFHLIKELFYNFYVLVCLLLFIRMATGLYSYYKKGRENPAISLKPARLVLVEEPVPPHSFLKNIFVNKNQHQNGEISDQIIEHELTHVKQKHSLDILFIEVLKIIFWFNPIFYFYKKAIQANHEFLADESVLSKTNDPISYQNLLLENVQPSYKTNLSSSFNYALTKKRFLSLYLVL